MARFTETTTTTSPSPPTTSSPGTTTSTATTTLGPVTTSSTPTTTTTTVPLTTTTNAVAGTTTLLASQSEGLGEPVTAAELGHSWEPGCPVPPDDLRRLRVPYLGFDGLAHEGDLIVHADHAGAVLSVFSQLHAAGYPIESIVPIGDLPVDAEDQAGYSNTSGFHCRVVGGTSRWSEHARGLAIDLNPHLNPFVTSAEIWPVGSEEYVDRSLGKPGMIENDDVVVTAFASIGWHWGGHWSSLKDYHHFSATGR